MRTIGIIRRTALVLALALPLGGCSSGGGQKPQYHEEAISSVDATVESIDYPTRTVTLKGDSGNSVTFAVDERVKNLNKVNVGDRVKIKYHESVAIEVRDPKEAGGDAATAGAGASVGEWAEAPDGTFGRQSTLTAVVERVDKKKGTADVRGPAGNVRKVWARDPKNLENVKAGDHVVITHREAMAVGIEPVKQ